MKFIKRMWHALLVEPFTWIFICFFQPARFKREFDGKSSATRLHFMLRLALPMFVCSYVLALLVQSLLLLTPSKIGPLGDGTGALPALLLATASATLLSVLSWVVGSVAVDLSGGIVGGIAWSAALGIAWGIAVQFLGIRGIWGYLTLVGFSGPSGFALVILAVVGGGIIGAVIGGMVGAVVGGFAGDRKGGLSRGIVCGFLPGFMGGIFNFLIFVPSFAIVAGIVAGITRPLAERFALREGTVGCFVGGILASITFVVDELLRIHLSYGRSWSYFGIGEWTVLIAGVGIAGCLIGGMMSIASRMLELRTSRETILRSIAIILAFSIVGSAAVLVSVVFILSGFFYDWTGINSVGFSFFGPVTGVFMGASFAMSVVLGLTLGTAKPNALITVITITLLLVWSYVLGLFVWDRVSFRVGFNSLYPLVAGCVPGIVFGVSYLLGSYRLPLYLVSSISALRAYLASQKNPPQVFTRLHRSSLHWDECVYLPLPGLKQALLLAADQNVGETLAEIDFIVHERPQQLAAARAASLEIAIREVELCDNLRAIAQFSERFADILPLEAPLIDPHWVAPFVRLNDASRDAARYSSPLGWQARQQALEEMARHLKKIRPHIAFRNAGLNRRLSAAVTTWLAVAQREREKMENAPEKSRRVANPYKPGPALELHDTSFVGRRDLAQQLGESLSRSEYRPTFLLYGERRMGKSSTLKHLSALLGARYLPIFYDLQSRDTSSSTAAFLGTIAAEITRVMSTRGMKTRKLEYAQLREASRENEATVYYVFSRWLEETERALEQADRTLLLTFDEFEKLEAAGQAKYLDLPLLLDWFRSVIQNHPRLALLFSGTHTLGEMGADWAGYMVNVQTLKVSFLQPEEAYQLITHPTPDFPGEDVFGVGVVGEIMRVTGNHPFLVQAVCSALVDHLNVNNVDRAAIQDVTRAVGRVLKNWKDTYFRDLWARTTEDQRVCLVALRTLGEGDASAIEQQSGLAGKVAHRTLEKLLDRDLVLSDEHGIYRIATPMFDAWVERCNEAFE
jgi:uncharacterized protein